MSSSSEQLMQLAEALTSEKDTEKLLRLSDQILDALDRVEAERNNSVHVD